MYLRACFLQNRLMPRVKVSIQPWVALETRRNPLRTSSLSLSPFVDFLSSAEPSPLLNILTIFITLHNAEAVVDFGRPAPPLFQLIPIDSRGCWSPFTCIGICMKIRRLHATPYIYIYTTYVA